MVATYSFSPQATFCLTDRTAFTERLSPRPLTAPHQRQSPLLHLGLESGDAFAIAILSHTASPPRAPRHYLRPKVQIRKSARSPAPAATALNSPRFLAPPDQMSIRHSSKDWPCQLASHPADAVFHHECPSHRLAQIVVTTKIESYRLTQSPGWG